MSVERDRDLLFGILAVQLRLITPAQLAQIGAAWNGDLTKSLPSRLLESGLVTPADRDILFDLVARAIEKHDNDPHATLTAFGGPMELLRSEEDDTLGVWQDDGEEDPASVSIGVPEYPGRYKLISQHARGGMGRIWVAMDNTLGRQIALKELIGGGASRLLDVSGRGLTAPAAPVARFLQEARVTGQLEHPSIVPVYELGHRADGTPYYTMKLVRGRTLSEAIEKCTDLRTRLELLPHFADLCNAIAYAHDRGVIHRDIKPQNVMVGEFGETVVIDWGLAKAKGQSDIQAGAMQRNLSESDSVWSSTHTSLGEVLGTPAYMAPEQARGDIEAIDERSDIYGLGAVLYALLTGNAPYRGKRQGEVLTQVRAGMTTPIAESEPKAPRELVAICERAMQTKPGARYPSAKDMVADIKRFQSGALVGAHDYSAAELIRRFVRRNRTVLATATAGLLIAVVLAVFYQLQLFDSLDRERTERTRAEEAVIAREDALAEALHERARAERENYYANIALARDRIDAAQFEQARAILDACPKRYRHFEWSLLAKYADLGLMTLTGFDGPVTALALDATGDQLLAGGPDGALLRFDLPGEAGDPWSSRQMRASIVVWHSETNRAGIVDAQGRVHIIDTATTDTVQSLPPGSGRATALAFHPQGEKLAVGYDRGRIAVHPLSGEGEVINIAAHLNDITALAFSRDGARLMATSRDNAVTVWDGATGSAISRIDAHTNDATGILALPGGRFISAGLDGQLLLHDNGASTTPLARLSSPITAMAASVDGALFAIGTEMHTIELWDAASGERQRELRGHSGPVRALVFDPQGDYLASGSGDRTVKLWDLERESRFARTRVALEGREFARFSVGFGAERIVAAGNYGHAVLWDLDDERAISTLECGVVDAMQLSDSGTHLLTLRVDGTIQVWELGSGRLAHTLRDAGLFSASLSPDGTRLAVGYRDGSVRVFGLGRDEPQVAYQPHAAPVTALEFLDNTNRLASGDWLGGVRVADVARGRVEAEWQTSGLVRSIKADGPQQWLAAASDATHVWKIADGAELGVLAGERPANTIAWSPDSRRIATGGEDGRITLWDTVDFRPVLTVDGETGAIDGLRFGADGRRLTAVGEVRRAADTLVLWDVPPWDDSPMPDMLAAWTRLRGGEVPGQSLQALVAALAVQGAPARTERAEAFVVALSPEEFDGLLRTVADILRTNRDARGYQGRLFVSEGMVVEPQSALAALPELGIASGDIILAINDAPLTSYDAAIEALHEAARGAFARLDVTLWRQGQVRDLVFAISDEPGAGP